MKKMKKRKDYFKHTTRALMTEEQKRATIAAIERGCQFLSERMRDYKIEEVRRENFYRLIYTARRRMIYLSRSINLIKGYSQPKFLYSHRRRAEISSRAFVIAKETGADYEAVREKFLSLMADYMRLG